MDEQQIRATAERIRALGVPDILNRWLSMTPAKWQANEIALRRIREGNLIMSTIGKKEQALRDTRENGKANGAGIAELAKQIEAIPAKKPDQPPQAASSAPEEKPKAKKEKNVVRKNSKTAKAPRTSVKGKTTAAKGNGPRPGSKLAIIHGLLTRAKGCTSKDVLEACEWPSVSMPQQAKALGLKLKKEKVDGVTVYRAA